MKFPLVLDLAVGALVVTAGMTALVFGLVQGPEAGWSSIQVLTAILGGLVLILFFLRHEARTPQPLLPLRLFKNRNLVVAMLATFIFMGTFGTMYYVFTVYLQDVLEMTPLEAGFAFLPWALLGIAGSKLAASLLRKQGVRVTLMTGMLLGGLGMVALGFSMSIDGNYWLALPGLTVLAAGQAMGFASMFLAAGTGVAPNDQGIAAAMASTTQQIGSAMGLAVLLLVAAVVADGEPSGPEATVAGLRAATFAAAGFTMVGLITASALRRDKQQRA